MTNSQSASALEAKPPAIVSQFGPWFLIVSLLAASLLVPRDWDSIVMALRVAACVAFGLVILRALPTRPRRWAISAILLFHFGGIATAVASVPPPSGPAPWITTQLWARVYRPYFQFLYMYNAYHFYSPDPGPSSIFWVCIDYSDGSQQWLHIPDRKEHMKDPLAVAYYRRLSITEFAIQPSGNNTVTGQNLDLRRLAGTVIGIPSPERIVEWLPGVPQYRPPNEHSRRLLSSYAAFIARSHPHPDGKSPVVGVKIYRVTHAIVPPDQFAAGREATDEQLYFPYFLGDFRADGSLKDPADPLLYWLMPIVKMPKAATPVRPSGPAGSVPGEPGDEMLNCVEIHSRAQRRVRP